MQIVRVAHPHDSRKAFPSSHPTRQTGNHEPDRRCVIAGRVTDSRGLPANLGHGSLSCQGGELVQSLDVLSSPEQQRTAVSLLDASWVSALSASSCLLQPTSTRWRSSSGIFQRECMPLPGMPSVRSPPESHPSVRDMRKQKTVLRVPGPRCKRTRRGRLGFSQPFQSTVVPRRWPSSVADAMCNTAWHRGAARSIAVSGFIRDLEWLRLCLERLGHPTGAAATTEQQNRRDR